MSLHLEDIDLPTVILIQIISSLILALTFLFITKGRMYYGLGYWVVSLLINSLTIFLTIDTTLLPDLAKIPFTNLSFITTYLLLNATVLKLREADVGQNPVAFFITIGILISLYGFNHPQFRMMANGVLFFVETCMVTRSLLAPKLGVELRGQGRYLFLMAVGIQAALFIYRIVSAYLDEGVAIIGILDHTLQQTLTMSTLVFTTMLFSLALLVMMIEKSNREITALLHTDVVTGAWNRRKAEELVTTLSDRRHTKDQRLSIIMADLDYFKAINDQFGHALGDTILNEFSKVMQRSLRPSDSFCRWGGEEFVIILPQTHYDRAGLIAERLRVTICEHAFDSGIKVTASFGYSEVDDKEGWRDALARADEALYIAKKSGRNRIIGSPTGA